MQTKLSDELYEAIEEQTFDPVDSTSMYSREALHDLRENDEISMREEAFMIGLLEDEDA
jgi:hypothetical protein